MKNYYDEHAKEFIHTTLDCNMKELYDFFLPHMEHTKAILDIGFGSGRDMLYFSSLGYEVYGIDPSLEMCKNAKELGLTNVYQTDVLHMELPKKMDAIWACASLLHVEANKLKAAFLQCRKVLKENGSMYCSFKYGDFEGERNGRYFIDMTEERLRDILRDTGLQIIASRITMDVRPENTTKWLNVILA